MVLRVPQAEERGRPAELHRPIDTPFDTKLWNPSGKATYQINQNNKLIGYYQWGQKEQPNRLPFAHLHLHVASTQTLKQISGSWVYKGEWNGTISDKVYVEARYGDFGYYFPLLANTDSHCARAASTTSLRSLRARDQKEQTDRQRRQATGSMTYFKDGWLGGSHNFKVGGELLLETGWYGYTQACGGNIRENDRQHGAGTSVINCMRRPRRRSAASATGRTATC